MSRLTSSPCRAAWTWAQVILLAANLGWTTLCLGGFLAQTMVVTSALTAALLAVHAVGWAAGWSTEARGERLRAHPAGWLFLPFAVYAAANVLGVTPVRWLGWFDWFGRVQMLVVFWVVLNGIRSRAARWAVWITLFAIAVTGVLFACYQWFVRPEWLILHRVQAAQYLGRASGPFGIPNSFAGLLILLLPTAGALACRRRADPTARVFFGWLMLVLLLGLGLTISRGGWLALAVALTAWPLLAGLSGRPATRPNAAGWRWRRPLLGSAAVLTTVVLAAAATYAVSPAVRDRFTQLVRDMGERSRPIVWRAGWNLACEHPLVGTGAGSFDLEFERFRPEGFLDRPYWAHNDYLNTLTDYGLIGFVLFFGAAALVTWRCARGDAAPPIDADTEPGLRAFRHQYRDAWSDPLVRQGQGIGLLAFALHLLVEFHLEMPALAMTFATVAALVVQRAWPDTPVVRAGVVPAPRDTSVRRERAARVALAFLGATAALAIPVTVTRAYHGEALRQRAREHLDTLADAEVTASRYRDQVADARTTLDQAVALTPGNAQAWSDRSYATAQWARLWPTQEKPLGAEAEGDANRALNLAPLCAEFWIRRGVARDLQGRWDQAGADFTQAIQLSPKTALPWFHYAYHLALRPPGHDMAAAMVEICLRLDPKNPEALRLRHHLATGHSGP